MSIDLATAYHEAGHAIAVQIRGGTVTSITIDPGLTSYEMPPQPNGVRFRNGVMVNKPEPQPVNKDDGFIAYAGSWAETRCRWTMPTLDTKDEHGHTFSTYVAAILRTNTSDYVAYQQAAKMVGAESLWSTQLERHWPAIQLVARRLYAEHLDHRRRQAQRRRWQARRRRHRSQVHM
jgi:hypothetical protein